MFQLNYFKIAQSFIGQASCPYDKCIPIVLYFIYAYVFIIRKNRCSCFKSFRPQIDIFMYCPTQPTLQWNIFLQYAIARVFIVCKIEFYIHFKLRVDHTVIDARRTYTPTNDDVDIGTQYRVFHIYCRMMAWHNNRLQAYDVSVGAQIPELNGHQFVINCMTYP